VVELVSGVVDWLGEVEEGDVVLGVDCVLLGELEEGDVVLGVDCELLGELGVLCAATQTADSNRIAVIRYTFFICVLLILPACNKLRPI
jgi:hypothetical protein